MANETKFSIIIPVYNTKENYLKECFDSVIKQKYDNYEVLVVDDGSNLATKDYLKKYESNPLFKIIHQENKGIVGARLSGLKNATGDYIFFLDSDDFIEQNSLLLFNEAIVNNKIDMILYEPNRFYEKDNKKAKEAYFLPEGIVKKEDVLKELISFHINGLDKVVKREIYQSIEEKIDSSIINGEDLQQSTYLTLNCNSFYQINKPIYYYRLHDEHEYYDVRKLNDANFPMPVYNMMFKENDEYKYLLPLFKTSSSKAILYIAFQICWLDINRKEKIKILDDLNNLEIIDTLKNIKENSSLIVELLFKLLVNKNYMLLNLASKAYKLII